MLLHKCYKHTCGWRLGNTCYLLTIDACTRSCTISGVMETFRVLSFLQLCALRLALHGPAVSAEHPALFLEKCVCLDPGHDNAHDVMGSIPCYTHPHALLSSVKLLPASCRLPVAPLQSVALRLQGVRCAELGCSTHDRGCGRMQMLDLTWVCLFCFASRVALRVLQCCLCVREHWHLRVSL